MRVVERGICRSWECCGGALETSVWTGRGGHGGRVRKGRRGCVERWVGEEQQRWRAELSEGRESMAGEKV